MLARHQLSFIRAHHIKTSKIPTVPSNASIAPLFSTLAPEFGASLAETTVAVASTREQLAVPQSYPDGQQFPPTLAAQVNHPEAQLPVGTAVVAAAPTGTTIVAPEEMMVVDEVAGQDVVSQFRPVRQHPPA